MNPARSAAAMAAIAELPPKSSETGSSTDVASTTPPPNYQKDATITYHKSNAASDAAFALTNSFTTDPLLRWCASNAHGGNIWDDDSLRSYFFDGTLRLCAGNNVPIVEASANEGDWGCVGIYARPGQKLMSIPAYMHCLPRVVKLLYKMGWTRSKKTMWTLPNTVKPVKAKTFNEQTLKKNDMFYIFFIGTQPKQRGQGLATKFLRECQDKARNYRNEKGELDPKPVWLESSSEGSKRVYEKAGFEVMGELCFGEDEVDKDGYRQGEKRRWEYGDEKGGELVGVRQWGMVWWPDEQTKRRYCNPALLR